MAIQFARLEYVSRSQGKNACCKGAYNSRSKIKDEQTNVVYNFHRIKDNVYHEILLPGHISTKFKNLETLMNTIERTERRKNSQLLKEYVIALPDNKELTLADRKELVHRFIKAKKFIEENLGVQLDLHRPHENETNWHAHILVTTRRFKEDGLGFAAKARDLDVQIRGGLNRYVQKENETIGQLWKDLQNEFFKEKGLDLKVDEIAETPAVHLGPVRMRGFMNEAAQFYADNLNKPIPIKTGEELLERITNKQSVFTISELKTLVDKLPGNSIQIQGNNYNERVSNLLTEATNSKELINLCSQEGDVTNFYTTKTVREEESRIFRIAKQIQTTSNNFSKHKDLSRTLEHMITNQELSQHQGEAIAHILASNSKFNILEGRAGTGKSHVLGKFNSLTQKHYNLIGLAPTHKAVINLRQAGFDESHTIKGFLFKYKNHKIAVPKNAVFVIDEAGMIDNQTMLEILKVVDRNNAGILLAGCSKQLSSVERGNMFEYLANEFGGATLRDTRRQETAWGKEVSLAFAAGQVTTGVSILEQQHRLIFEETPEAAMVALLQDWATSKELLENKLILTIANKNVDALNLGAREILRKSGKITGRQYNINNGKAKGMFAVGDRIVFTETNKELNATNGDFGKIIEVSLKKFVVQTDEHKLVEFSPKEIAFKHGYAANIFKSQGASIKDVYVYHSGYSNLNNSYVKMSRHITDLHLYCNKKNTQNKFKLISQLARSAGKQASLWYKTSEDLKREQADPTFGEKLSFWVKDKMEVIGDAFHNNANYYVFEKPEIGNAKVEEMLNEIDTALQDKVGVNENFVYKTSNGSKSHDPIASFTNENAVEQNRTTEKLEPALQNNKAENPITPINITTEISNGSQHKVVENEDLTANSVAKASELRLEIAQDLKSQKPIDHTKNKTAWHDNVARTRHELKYAAERVSTALLGEPNRSLSSAKTLRFGEHGKIAVEITGSKAGTWYDFATSTGGDLLSLMQRELNLDFKGAISEAEKIIGKEYTYKIDVVAEKVLKEQAKDLTAKEKAERVKTLYNSSVRVKGVAEQYLKNTRGIHCAIPNQEIRMLDHIWHSNAREKMPALFAVARDQDGQITGGQVIYLDRKTSAKTEAAPAKKSFGKIHGSFVEIQSGNINVTLLAEGLETTLSLKEAQLPGKVLCTLGVNNFKNYPAKPQENIVICADNDGQNAKTNQTVIEAKETLQALGANVVIVKPNELGDYNDVLKTKGAIAIKEQIMPELSKHLELKWLEAWNAKEKCGLDGSKLLQNHDPEHAQKLYKEALIENKNTVEQFLQANTVQLETLQQLIPNYDLADFTAKLQGLTTKQMQKVLHDTQYAAFKNNTLTKHKELQQQKQEAKTINNVINIYEQEKTFYTEINTNYSKFLNEFSREGFAKITLEAKRYADDPKLLDNFKRDVANAASWNTNAGKPEYICEYAKEFSLYTVQKNVFDSCSKHVNDTINKDLAFLNKHGELKKDDFVYKTEKDYLQATVKDPQLKPYIAAAKFEHRLEEIKQLELQQQQDRGRSR